MVNTTASVTFANASNYDVVLTLRGGTPRPPIKPIGRDSVQVSLGDIFDVEFKVPQSVSQPVIGGCNPIVISDLNVGVINLKFNLVLRTVLGFSTLRILRCQPNLCGFDLSKIKPRLVLPGFLPKPIFQSINPESIAYELQAPYYLPQGLLYRALQYSEGSSTVKLSYSYAAFANSWSLNIGVQGKNPTSGTGAKLDVGYNQFTNEERASTNVYASTREQKAVYSVTLDPEKAYLDPDFIAAVESVTTVEDAKTKIIKQYGTHCPRTIFYGGDRSVYMVMKEDTYSKATGSGISVKAEVSKSADAVSSSKYTDKMGPTGKTTEGSKEETTTSSEVASGKLGFEYSENQQVKDLSSQTTNGYQIVGGDGGFTSWSVTDDTAVAVAIKDSDYLYNLIEPKVFKNGTAAEVLEKKKDLIRQAIDIYLKNMPTLGKGLPSPRTYTITLKSLEVIEEVDDANKNTKGTVTATVTPSRVGFDGSLWNRTDWSTVDLKYTKGQKFSPNTTKKLVHPPSADGSFAPLQLTVSGNIYERDDLVDGQQQHSGSTSIDLNHFEEGETTDLSFDCSAFASLAARGTIRVTVGVALETSEFENALFSSPLFSLENNFDGQPASTMPQLKLFKVVSDTASHPEMTLKVDPGYKIIGGGARVGYNTTGNLLIASFPQDAQTWVAKSKDHQVSSPSSIYVYAIAIYDPNNEWDVKIFSTTSTTAANHPTAKATVGAGYVLTGGGAKSNSTGAGNLLTASYPDSTTTWTASSKDHLEGDPTTITAYAIGLKSTKAVPLSTKIFNKTSASSGHPSITAFVDTSLGYTLVGGGAQANWQGGEGNLLIKSFPDGTGWKVGSKDHIKSAPCTITAYAIGLKVG